MPGAAARLSVPVMIALEMPAHEVPRPEDLGPDPEPSAPRFEVLMEMERRSRYIRGQALTLALAGRVGAGSTRRAA